MSDSDIMNGTHFCQNLNPPLPSHWQVHYTKMIKYISNYSRCLTVTSWMVHLSVRTSTSLPPHIDRCITFTVIIIKEEEKHDESCSGYIFIYYFSGTNSLGASKYHQLIWMHRRSIYAVCVNCLSDQEDL